MPQTTNEKWDVVIHVRGGVVTNVFTNHPSLKVVVRDYDDLREEEKPSEFLNKWYQEVKGLKQVL
jgi:sulfur relay (sulfurtransferase) DsrC/TusE family protein